jgi:hypothetical protein
MIIAQNGQHVTELSSLLKAGLLLSEEFPDRLHGETGSERHDWPWEHVVPVPSVRLNPSKAESCKNDRLTHPFPYQGWSHLSDRAWELPTPWNGTKTDTMQASALSFVWALNDHSILLERRCRT